jgi:predicted signal transduction protein with EAL and GGDEF domain
MSLFRQLWLVIIISTLVAFAGSFVISMATARHFLTEQLAIKNNDNASSLARSISQLAKEPIAVERLVVATFNSGQYAAIRLIDPEGKVLIEKTDLKDPGNAPEWFIHLVPIPSKPGQAQISSDGELSGTVELISKSQFAYKALWRGTLSLLLWFFIVGGLIGLIGMQWLRRRIKRPLDAIIRQAQAISERRLIHITEPSTADLKSLARTMNAMVDRLKSMFSEETARLEKLRREASIDHLTGLANRSFFLNQLDAALRDDDAAPSGSLLILRLADLAGINQRAGRKVADELLRRLGAILNNLTTDRPTAAAARLNGADFALLLPGIQDPAEEAEKLLSELHALAADGLIEQQRIGHIASGTYLHGQAIGGLLARIDVALASAENQSGLSWQRAESSGEMGLATNADWKKLLQGAIETQRLRLVEFPVTSNGGQLLHLECPLRLQASDHGELLPAGSFMPMAARLAMTAELDLAATRLALERIAAGAAAVAVNLAGQSIADASFRQRLETLIASRKELAPRLWLEISEVDAFQYFAEFQGFCNALHPFGCRLGIEHFGRQFSQIGRLHNIGLNYLKVDCSFIHGINIQPGNQTILKNLCTLAHDIGLTVIAEGVQTAEELATLPGLGFDAATGSAVQRN